MRNRLTIRQILLSVSLGFGFAVQAQTTSSEATTGAGGGGAASDWTQWPVTSRDGGSTTREWTEITTNTLTGEILPRTHRVIQLANGLNYQDASGAWQESRDEIELSKDGGAAALHGQHKVLFSPAGLNDDAAVSIVTPSGQTLTVRVQGIYYVDTASGQSRLLVTSQTSNHVQLEYPLYCASNGTFPARATASGDCGSPIMWLTYQSPRSLVFTRGFDVSGPDSPTGYMQQDMNTLTDIANGNPYFQGIVGYPAMTWYTGN